MSHQRRREDFNKDWKFLQGDVINANSLEYLSDHFWPRVDLPHDWSIRGPFREEHASTMRGAYLPTGVGWYRKHFELAPEDKGGKVLIHFEGVYQKSEVYVNGHHVGFYPNGYQSFFYDITPYLEFGDRSNLIAVRVDNSVQPGSRYYTGSGIYRKVELEFLSAVHVAPNGTFVYAKEVDVDARTAQLAVQTDIQVSTDEAMEGQLGYTILRNGEVKAHWESAINVKGMTTQTLDQECTLADVDLWDLETPHLYDLKTEIFIDGHLMDSTHQPFGIRKIEFNRDKGFLLNDRQVKIRGVCLHHDNGSIGAEAYPRAEERKVELVRTMGANAIRATHNPVSREFLDICDRRGMLVMCEAFDEWEIGKCPGAHSDRAAMYRINIYGYHLHWEEWHEYDLRAMLRKDRNHPSIILWSTGNEVREVTLADPRAPVIGKKLQDICHEMDPSREATCCIYGAGEADQVGFGDIPDVMGYNYSESFYQEICKEYPQRRFIGSENASHTPFLKRGHHDIGGQRTHKVKYEHHAKRKAISENSMRVHMENDFATGLCIWTGIDYLGEPTPYAWPSRSSYFAPIDLAGFPKDSYYFYKSQWCEEPVLHLLPHWNLHEHRDGEIPVCAYSNADEVEIFINGKSQGRKAMPTEGPLHLEWLVNWEPGTLSAVGYKDGKEIVKASNTTTGAPKALELDADRSTIVADGYDLSFVTCRVVDDEGQTVPVADNSVTFSLTGPGEILSVDNGDPEYIGDLRGNAIPALSGLCLVVIKAEDSPGAITVRAEAEGLNSTEVVVQTTAPKVNNELHNP